MTSNDHVTGVPKRTARTMSSFGQFQMGHSHIKSKIEEVIPKPRAYDMAAELRDGKTLQEVAEAFDLAPNTVKTRLSQGGWGSDGNPKPPRKGKKK